MSGAVPAMEDSAEDSVLKDRVLIGKFEEIDRDEGVCGSLAFW